MVCCSVLSWALQKKGNCLKGVDFHRCLKAISESELVHRDRLEPLHFHNLLAGFAGLRLSILHLTNLFAEYHIFKIMLCETKEIYPSKLIKGVVGWFFWTQTTRAPCQTVPGASGAAGQWVLITWRTSKRSHSAMGPTRKSSALTSAVNPEHSANEHIQQFKKISAVTH